MRTTLDVDERTANRLRELAAESGASIDEVLAAYVPGLRRTQGNGADAEETVLAFEEWAESFPQAAPPLSNEAVSRASIYRDQ
jgi:hypothetical protein